MPPHQRRGMDCAATTPSPPRDRQFVPGGGVTEEPIAPRAETAGMTARHHEDRAATFGDCAPCAPSSSTMLLPHGLFAPRRAPLFGLDNTAASLARTICPNAQTYVERPMVLPRDADARQQASELPDFSQVRGLPLRTWVIHNHLAQATTAGGRTRMLLRR